MSLTLATGDTIAGVASSATAITYTFMGDEIGTADAFRVLAQGQLPSAIATLYTVPAATSAIVKSIHLVNTTAGTVTASLTVKGTAAANQILPPCSILAGGWAFMGDEGWSVYNSQGQLLSVGATGATGATGANGLATSGTPAVVLSTTAAAGVASSAIATDATIIAFDVTAPNTQAFGDAAATGAAAVAARRDHKHGMPASPAVPAAATTVTGPDAYGAAAAVGTGTSYARNDHDHGLPASGGTTYATPAIVLGTAAAAGAAASTIRSDATIVAFDVTVPVVQAFGDAAAVGAAAVAGRRDHKHGMPADPTGNALGLTGATATTRYVGATASGAPISGTFALGDYVIDQTGKVWICTTAGTPGTWAQVSGGGASPLTTKGDLFGHSTVDARLPVGANTQVLTADSTQVLGVKWAASGGAGATPAVNAAALVTAYSLFR